MTLVQHLQFSTAGCPENNDNCLQLVCMKCKLESVFALHQRGKTYHSVEILIRIRVNGAMEETDESEFVGSAFVRSALTCQSTSKTVKQMYQIF